MAPTLRSAAPLAAVLLASVVAACRPAPAPQVAPAPTSNTESRQTQPLATLGAHRVIPAPASVAPGAGAPFTLTATTGIVVPAGDTAAARVGQMLAALLRPATGFRFPVAPAGGAAPPGAIALRMDGTADLGAEGYELTVTPDSVRLTAARPAGLFRGVQTLRQLLPAGIEAQQSAARAASAWTVPPGRIVDRPRFAWRGGMLDVARHFFTVDEVKQYVDLLALYKFNTLHLHLSDDQGWRIQIDSRPKLTAIGGSTEVGGGPGGFYTKADYAEIVRYAGDRFLTVVPELDMPAHTQAASASYPELGCGRPAPDAATAGFDVPAPGLYTGIHVGFSALCSDKETTYKFVDDVVGELAAMTPGPYLHLGGDEVAVLSRAQYAAFVERAQEIVARHGKTMVGWDEIGRAKLRPGTIAQLWRADTAMLAARQGAKLVLSPATNAYLDMQYTPATELGLHWAAYVELRTAYDWDPVTRYPGVREGDVLGVEAPLWTETVQNITAAEYLLLPRLPALAEVGWAAAGAKDWEGFRARVAAHAPRWRYLGINYYPSPQVAW
ncbi:beta-N-acetylhexosaminidase [Gemmatimonadetes bacterium T265]|nr:beta-N-acetylhexosaminidase [Gemmatimonadetes bacterium T265]